MRKIKGNKLILILALVGVSVFALALLPTPSWAPRDSDGDGLADNQDDCDDTPPCTLIDSTGCTVLLDLDCDTYYADEDCDDDDPARSPGLSEICGDSLDNDCDGDVDDADSDCAGGSVGDLDSDGIEDSLDNCPTVSNPGQGDMDLDGDGDVCDSDTDGDGVANSSDDDDDNDGFSDALELTGFSYYDGSSISSCVGSGGNRDDCENPAIRSHMVDPLTQDAYIILRWAAPLTEDTITHYSIADMDDPYYQNFDVLALIRKPKSLGGLGIVCHVISQQSGATDPNGQAAPTRQVSPSSPQKAIRVTEDLTAGVDLGNMTRGTPMYLDDGQVFTRRIRDLVNGELDEDSPDVWVPYVQHTYAHEIGHSLKLYPICDNKHPLCHMPGGSEKILEQFVEYKYSNREGRTIFYTGTEFTTESQLAPTFFTD